MNAGRNPDKKSRQRSDSSTESSTDKKSPEYNVLVMFSPYSMEDLKSYANDERHLAVARICRGIAEERVAVDFEF